MESILILGNSQNIENYSKELLESISKKYNMTHKDTLYLLRGLGLYNCARENWNGYNNVYMISTATDAKHIYICPQSINYMLNLSKDFKNCVIDCLEHIYLYCKIGEENDQKAKQSIFQFLYSLSDNIRAKQGHLIIITDPKVWESITLEQLKRWSNTISLEDLIK
ncbi:MAG: hypothetical protein QXQ79_02335 [Candidatus Nanoarchaeia archaeon]